MTLDAVREDVYIGPIQAAYLDEELRRLNVSHVINASGSRYSERDFVQYLHIDIEDSPDADIGKAFGRTCQFISEALDHKGAVLVHCEAGKSRSVTLLAAYLMSAEGLTATEAIEQIRAVHPRADPNSGFVETLRRFESSHKVRHGALAVWGSHAQPHERNRLVMACSHHKTSAGLVQCQKEGICSPFLRRVACY